MKKTPKGATKRRLQMLPEYDFRKGVRGKYAGRYASGTNVVVLSPEVAQVFPDSESVNDALRALVKITRRQSKSRGLRRERPSHDTRR